MPIFMLAVLAVLVFLSMGLMLFYAAYKEAHEPESKVPAPKPVAH